MNNLLHLFFAGKNFHLTRIKVLELEAAGEIEALDLDVRAEMSASVAELLRG